MSENNTREIEIAELMQVMSSQSGRNVMFRLLDQTGVDEDMFDADTHKHAHNAGRRSVGLWLKYELKKACLPEYLMMIKENTNG